MEGISDIKIIGTDDKRPAKILKEPYINLYFKLSHKAPADWCARFNDLVAKTKYGATINTSEGLFIETWMRKPEEIQGVLDEIKAAVTTCTEAYIDKIRLDTLSAAASSSSANLEEEGEQGRLNRIITGLDYGD